METKTLGTLIYERRDDGIAVVTLNREERMNAIGGTMKDDLAQAFFHLARTDPGVRCVVITGAGQRAFCAGADIKERAERQSRGPEFYARQRATHELFSGIESFEKPVIAAINGVAYGGGLEIALCCDLRVASTNAKLALPEVKLGVIPAAGGTQRLPRLIGAARTKELIFTGDPLTAEQALAIGLVNRVTAPDALMSTAVELAQRIAAQPPLAVYFAKRAINMGVEADINAAIEFERYAAAMLVDTDDRKEGMRAFVEKRPPKFKGE